ncbi:MAG TPA: ATP synthase F1 subunit epsilon [Phycisphaerae bacterium]|nr:ATP synthase F1 subunit epsilon [Phycisphaerae bacterium]HRR84035.1 ATP synthase F1 subunit epsilon [Phycisphaerae bacterium]
MAEKTFKCSVLTPEARVFEGDVESVVLPAHDGEIGVLFCRAPLLCKLGAGSLRLRKGTETQTWFVDGGFAQVIENQVTVLTQKALRPEEISAADAQARLEEALKMPAGDDAALRRKNRIVAGARAQLRMALM